MPHHHCSNCVPKNVRDVVPIRKRDFHEGIKPRKVDVHLSLALVKIYLPISIHPILVITS